MTGALVLWCAGAPLLAVAEPDLPSAAFGLPASSSFGQAGGIVSVPGSTSKISLDLRGMDVIDVLKLFAQRSGLNIVAGRNVQGRVTMFLKEVELWDAFELVLLANGLAYERLGNIINVMTDRDYELVYGQKFGDKRRARTLALRHASAADLSRSLNQVKSTIGRVVVDEGTNTLMLFDTPEKLAEMEELAGLLDEPIVRRVYTLNYAKAEDIEAKLQDLVTKGIGKVETDERTNKLIITELERKLPELERVIDSLDAKTKEVLIDAKIVQVELSDKHQVGVDWEALYSQLHDLNIKGSFDVSISSFGTFKIGQIISGNPNENDFKFFIEALQTFGRTELLSSPRITAISGQEAKILVGVTRPYVTTTTTTTTSASLASESVQFIDVGIKLFVTPIVNDNGFITMKIRPEVSSVTSTLTTANKNEIPIVDKTEAESSVMVKDGVTIVIGGLVDTSDKLTEKKFPILGDIPLLGMAFRSRETEVIKKEKIIFLTPHIISGDRDSKHLSLKQDPMFEPMPKTQHFTKKETKRAEETIAPVSPLAWEASPVEYQQYVRDQVFRALSARPEVVGFPGTVHVNFTLTREGRLKARPAVEMTDNPRLDALVVETIVGSEPFPPFPPSMAQAEEWFSLPITIE